MQKNLIVEEFKEFLEADLNMALMHPPDRAACLKELADLIYVCAQYAENMDWDIEQALRRVHQSNMSKLGEDGKPIYRKDGKVLKGPQYQPPDLTSDLVKMKTDLVARTGRVQSWIDDPNSRLPVSCTVFVVENEMEGPNGIEASWRFASHALRYGAGLCNPPVKT